MLRASAGSGLIRAAGLVLSLLVNIVMARLLMPTGYGLYSFVLATVAILTIPAAFGLPALVVRETARAMVENNVGGVWYLWGWAHRFVLLTCVCALVLGGTCLILFADVNNYRPWAWGGALLPLLALAYLRSAAIRGLGHPLLGQLPEAILRPAAVILITLALAGLLGQDFTAETALIASVTGTAVSLLLGLTVLFRLAPPRPRVSAVKPAPRMQRAWVLSAVTIGLANSAQTLGANTDILFVGALLSESEVGIYKIALSGASLVGFGLQAVNVVLMQRIAVLHRAGDMTAMASTLRLASRLVFGLTLVAVVFLALFGKWLIVTLFGAAYTDGFRTMLIIGSGQLASAFFGSVLLVLAMTGHERETLHGTVGFTIMNILLNAVLVPLAGKEGAAVATAASLIALNVYLWRVAHRKLGINTMAFG